MASDEESNRAPEKFNLGVEGEEEEDLGASLNTEHFLKCPLCTQRHKSFYCEVCLRNGTFIRSGLNLTPYEDEEYFCEKQKLLALVKERTRNMQSSYNVQLQRPVLIDTVTHRIKVKRERVQMFKKVILDKKKVMINQKLNQTSLEQKNKDLKRTLPKYNVKVREMEDCVSAKVTNLNKKLKEKDTLDWAVRQVIQNNVKQLIKYIFPIEKCSSVDSSGICPKTIELSEATRTACFDGSWVVQDSLGELQHMIVAPYLPSSGNYAMYCDWVGRNRDNSIPNNLNYKEVQKFNLNPAFAIGAALTYTAQLVQILSIYLNIRLPFKTACADFCNGLLSESAFYLKVCRLNANILFLLYREGICLNEVQPQHTLENLLQFLDSITSEGHRPTNYDDPTVTNFNLVESQFTMRYTDNSGSDSDTEDESKLHSEWESLDIVPQIVVAASPPANPQSASLMNSAAASLVSMFRGWTTGR